MVDEKHMDKVIKDMLEQAGGEKGPIIPGIDDLLGGLMQNLEKGLMQLSAGQQQLGLDFFVARCAMDMILNILVDKEIIPKEELQEKYQTEVIDLVQETIDKQRDAARTAVAEQATAQKGLRCVPDECSGCPSTGGSCGEENGCVPDECSGCPSTGGSCGEENAGPGLIEIPDGCGCTDEAPVEEAPSADDISDVILASERGGEPKKFS